MLAPLTLAISADALPKDIQRAKAAGFADYVTKPFVVTEMLQAIRSATHHTIH